MEEYIPKDALVAEIEKRKKQNVLTNESAFEEDIDILSFIGTLEVKGVDFDFTKEVDMWIEDNGDSNGFFNVDDLAKYFFKLGMAASNKAQKGE